MSKPLALVYYSNLLPGSQLAGRLLDLGYRVQSLSSAVLLPETCETEMPLVLIAEIAPVAEEPEPRVPADLRKALVAV